MFTLTNSPSSVSNLRNFSHHDKTVPALRFYIKSNSNSDLTGQLLLLLPNIRNYKVRLLSEIMYLASTAQINEEQVNNYLNTVIHLSNDMKVVGDFYEKITATYNMMDVDNNLIELSDKTLSLLLLSLKVNKSIAYSLDIDVPHATRVPNFEAEEIMNLAREEEWFDSLFERLSNRGETVSFYNRYFYPEDCFNFPNYGTLEYHNTLSGNMYSNYETALYAYTTNQHFSKNRDLFKDIYCGCGGELTIRVNMGMYTTMHCINPFCYEKMSISLSDFAGELGIMGLGHVTLETLTKGVASKNLMYRGYSYVTLRELLLEDNNFYLNNAAGYKWLEFLEKIKGYTGMLSNLIQAINIPYLSSEASRILTSDILNDDSMTPIKLLEECKKKGKHDVKFVLSMWMHLEDFRFIVNELAVNTKKEILEEYLIYITKGIMLEMDDGTVNKMSKSQFVNSINALLEESGVTNIMIRLNNSLTSKCKALIADHQDGTGSITNARRLGVPILTSREFLLQIGGGSDEREEQ